MACEELGLTLQRWTQELTLKADGRTTVQRPTPANALSETERQAVLTACNHQDYADLPPSQIVPRLADQRIYLASESTFYRVLRAEHRRGRGLKPHRHPAPTTYTADAPNQVWSWDITYLPSPVRLQAPAFLKLHPHSLRAFIFQHEGIALALTIVTALLARCTENRGAKQKMYAK